MGDVVSVLKDAPGLIEDRVGIGCVRGHEVDGSDIHVGGEGPDVQVVDVDDTGYHGEVVAEQVEVDAGGCGLYEDAQRLIAEAPGPGEDEYADKCCEQRVGVWPVGEDHDEGGYLAALIQLGQSLVGDLTVRGIGRGLREQPILRSRLGSNPFQITQSGRYRPLRRVR